MQNEVPMQYPDVAPEGYTLASNEQPIDANDMVFYSGTATRDAKWDRPKRGENIIGAQVRDHWPGIMALAVKR